ncbi:hypothetical protein PD280_06220 [Virgibacillus salarius]|uniref:hypothetical protein n=1 Tax=Virgibacillus salarius TaxID=447199 RepID=UPI0024921151|nr:hypothetical protein [Virgibacillus salarius]WBX81313.1 hypothetical protein PD280_06220 [Virgibacillus salarius]
MSKDAFQEYMIDSMVNLHLKLHYPRIYGYDSGVSGTYERLRDEMKYEHLIEVASNNQEWDLEEMGRQVSMKIREKTNIPIK